MDRFVGRATRNFAAGRDGRRAPWNSALESWPRSTSHRLLQSLDHLCREPAIDWFAGAGIAGRAADEEKPQCFAAGPGSSRNLRRAAAFRDARVVAFVLAV